VRAFGDAGAAGSSTAGACKDQRAVGVAASAVGGYWLVTAPPTLARLRSDAHPLDVLAAESEQLRTLLSLVQQCQGRPPEGLRLGSPRPGARMTTGYGWRTHPVYRRAQFHTGVDLGGRGSALAMAAGTVVEARERVGYGNTVVVDHGNGVATIYAHLAGFAVGAGERVDAGQPLGSIGATGFATGIHLHVEVRVHGEPTNPLDWFSV
jgi:murein DD-endopeptidase MepM/ murein hydrolase activator NlpD